MDWTRQIDGYCERLGPGLWAEPANALTNLAFIAVALWLWPRTRGIERCLVFILFLIGVGSGLFHTFAMPWAALADTLPIAFFILVYLFAANRVYLGLGVAVSLAGMAAFVPVAMIVGRGLSAVPGLAVSAPYWPVAGAIALYAWWLRDRLPVVARGLAIGEGLLGLSLLARSVDAALCGVWPVGTHFAWHLMNAAMLGWMITVLRRHRLEARGGGG